MLQDNYFEFMVKKKTTMKDLVIRSICIYFVTLGFMVMPIFWLGCVATWIIYKQFIYPLTDVEYEYLLCDRQITVDKIMGQAKRKQFLKNFAKACKTRKQAVRKLTSRPFRPCSS